MPVSKTPAFSCEVSPKGGLSLDQIVQFQEEAPSLETYWRSIILFGRNVASYKFALSESLLDLAKEDKTIVSLDDLAIPYAQHLCEHLKTAPKQATSSTSRFLEACKQFNEGMISEDELRATTVSLGFNNVIDAFHNVNGGEIPIRFYEKDYYQKKHDKPFKENICFFKELNQLFFFLSISLFISDKEEYNATENCHAYCNRCCNRKDNACGDSTLTVIGKCNGCIFCKLCIKYLVVKKCNV